MKTIIFVDDKKLTLRELKKIFQYSEHNCIYINGSKDALEYLEVNHVDLICANMIMSEISGFELLRIVKEKYPEIIRVSLSRYTNKRIISDLIRENLVSMYIFKPWNPEDLFRGITNILKTKAALKSKEIVEYISVLKRLPSLPTLYEDLTRMIKNDRDIDEIAKVIEMDQGITSQILRVANSAFYGRRTGSIPQAIMNIGLTNLKTIVLANSIFVESAKGMKTVNKLWKHTILSNKFTEAIYKECLNKTIPAIFSLAGLLHEIGKVIFYCQEGDEYEELIRMSEESDTKLTELEIEKFGVTHQDLGGYLLNWWDLPFAYVEAAMFHHRPLDDRVVNTELISVINIANYYASVNCDNMSSEEVAEEIFNAINISKEDVEVIIDRIISENV